MISKFINGLITSLISFSAVMGPWFSNDAISKEAEKRDLCLILANTYYESVSEKSLGLDQLHFLNQSKGKVKTAEVVKVIQSDASFAGNIQTALSRIQKGSLTVKDLEFSSMVKETFAKTLSTTDVFKERDKILKGTVSLKQANQYRDWTSKVVGSFTEEYTKTCGSDFVNIVL